MFKTKRVFKKLKILFKQSVKLAEPLHWFGAVGQNCNVNLTNCYAIAFRCVF